MPVLGRSANASDAALRFDEQVAVGRGDVDHSVLKLFAVDRLLRAQRTFAFENVREKAGSVRWDVNDDEDRRREVGGQPPDDLAERVEGSCRSSDDDYALI